jgi:protein-disulfide isomerase
MRIHRVLLAAVTALVLIAAVGCARDISGTARPDPEQPPVALTQDGAGIVAGFADAPVQIEFYTEPQCKTCAEVQADFGDAMRRYISIGQLAVTYRPVLFSDTEGDDYSSRVANALFLTADTPTPGPAFQTFVQELWGDQDSGGDGPSNAQMADMARKAGVPSEVADRIDKGDSTVDVEAAADSNLNFLFVVNGMDPSTPTIYDLNTDELIDIYDNNWLSKLMSRF